MNSVTSGNTLVVYHRCGGKSLGYPPNTLFTIKWALKFGAKAVEYDVVLCKDGETNRIIMIEPKLLKAYNLDMDHLEWSDVQKINAGNEKFGKLPISLLDDVLQEVAGTDLAQQIQIKGEHPGSVKTVLEKTKNTKNYIITAFDLNVIKEIKERDKEVCVGWLVKPAQEQGGEGTTDLTAAVTSNPDALAEYSDEELKTILTQAKTNNVDVVLLCGPRIKSPEIITKIHKEGMEVGAWGVGTNLDLAKRLISFNIDRFTLDNPEQLN